MDIRKLVNELESNKQGKGKSSSKNALRTISKEMWKALKEDNYDLFHKAFQNSMSIAKDIDDDG